MSLILSYYHFQTSDFSLAILAYYRTKPSPVDSFANWTSASCSLDCPFELFQYSVTLLDDSMCQMMIRKQQYQIGFSSVESTIYSH